MKLTSCRLIILVVIGLILIQCSPGSKNKIAIESTSRNKDFLTINIDTLNIKESLLASEIFNGITVIPLETNDNCLIGSISQVEIFNDTIYVLDRTIAKTLFVFDQNGKFVRKIGAVGKGPGEFLKPNMFVLNKKKHTVLILDQNSKRILEYSLSGEFITSISLQGDYITNQIAIQNGNVYIDNLPRRGQDGSFWLYSIDKEGNVVNRWFSFEDYNKGFVKLLSIASNFYQAENDIKYVKPFFDTIFTIKNNVISPFIALSSDNKVTEEDISRLNDSKTTRDLGDNFVRLTKFHGISRYFENSNLILFDFKNKSRIHKFFYWPESDRIVSATDLIDDFTNVYPLQLVGATDNNFVSVLQGRWLVEFIKNVHTNRTTINASEMELVKDITEGSNPVLVFYRCN